MNIIQEMEYYNQLEREYEKEMIYHGEEEYQRIGEAQAHCIEDCANCIANGYCNIK